MLFRRGIIAFAAWIIGCTSIAGVDGDYTLGVGGSSTSSARSSAQASTARASAASTASSGGGDRGGGGGARDPMWVLIDTLTVDCQGGTVMSNVSLNNGEQYTLRASGECTCTGRTGCDAEWLDFGAPQTNAYSNDVDMGIGIDDPNIDLNRLPDWGPYSATHEYEAMWTGAGAAIAANYHDPDTTNNTGQLTLEILQLQ